MARTPVSDLSHFGGTIPAEVPPAARRLAAYIGSIVQAATASPSGEIIPTPLHCRRRPAKEAVSRPPRRPSPGRPRRDPLEMPGL